MAGAQQTDNDAAGGPMLVASQGSGARDPIAPASIQDSLQEDDLGDCTIADSPTPEPRCDLAREFEGVAETFLSADPDLARLNALAAKITESAEVVEGSVVRGTDGSVHGDISVPSAGLEGTFQVADDRYSIYLDATGGCDSVFLKSRLSFSFAGETGIAEGASLGLQFHPDTRQPASSLLEPDQEKYVGWVCSFGDDGATARPLSMRLSASGDAWMIGHSEKLPCQPRTWIGCPVAHDTWLEKLQHLVE